MTGFCYPEAISQKSRVGFAGQPFHNNPSTQACTSLIFAIMQRSRARYFIEIIIHALFWLGVYYALKALTASSYSMVIDHGDGAFQSVGIRLFFPYSWIILASLTLLFYSNAFWLFKKAIRFKSDFRRMAVIAGWSILVF